MKKNELIKASAAIHIPHKLSLDQQRTWNVLLSKAFPDLGKQQIHEITEQDLLSYYAYEHRHTDRIKADLEKICGTTVTYNMLGKDKKTVWGVFTMLAEAELKDGVLRYAYAPTLAEKLQNPAIYAKINLRIQQRFGSKYALAIYELCVDYVDAPNGNGTPMMELQKFREYLGIEGHEYQAYRDLNKWVIKKSTAEINRESDIKITLKTKKSGRKITHIKFFVERKKSSQLKKISPPEGQVYEMAESFGIENIEIFFDDFKHDEILKSLHYMKRFGGRISNAGGFLRRCLENQWWYPEDEFAVANDWFCALPVAKTDPILDALEAGAEDQDAAYADYKRVVVEMWSKRNDNNQLSLLD